MARDSCLTRIAAGVAIGGAVGGAVGAVYGTYEAIWFKIISRYPSWSIAVFFGFTIPMWLLLFVPGLMKVRYIGRTTVGSAAIFGLFLGAGSLIHCGKSY